MPQSKLHLVHAYQQWPMRKVFRISRMAQEWSPVHVVHISDGVHIGRGECGELPHYGDTPQSVEAQILELATHLDDFQTPERLHAAFPASSARNAVDAALWDLKCKREGRSVWDLSGVATAPSIAIDFTIGIAAIEDMCRTAMELQARGYREIKIKVNATDVIETVSAIAKSAPAVHFIVDANEAWSFDQLKEIAPALTSLNVALIEQPLHRDVDHQLAGWQSPIPLYADESFATSDDIDKLSRLYDGINIKLDKCGGFTEALRIVRKAQERGVRLMIGCSGATSLGLAPAYVIGTMCGHRDLDSAGLHYDDRTAGMVYSDGHIHCFTPALWG